MAMMRAARWLLCALSLTAIPGKALAQAHVYPPLPTSAADFQAHLTDATDAHDASAISVAAIVGLVATNVQAAIAELHAAGGGGIDPALATAADQVLYSTAASTWTVATVAANQIMGKAAIGAVKALTAGEVRTIINVGDGATITDATTVGAAGALMSSTCVDASTAWGCTGMGTAGILTPAQLRTAAGLSSHSALLPVGVGSPGTLATATMTTPQWDATARLPYVRVTGSADSGTAQFAWTWLVPATRTDWAATWAKVSVRFSDITGNNGATVTCIDTAGATILNAFALAESALVTWESLASAGLGVGTYTVDGLLSCRLDITTDTADTVDIYGGLRLYWTH